VRLKQAIDQYNPEWLGGWMHQGFDPLETRTEIGQIGRIKTSSQIVIRLETPGGTPPPGYLREAGYRTYKSGVWYAGSSKDDFVNVPEEPVNSGQWPLLPARTNIASLNIACYVPGGKGLLPLPTASGQLEQLPAFEIQKNGLGAVRADGPGLVIFNALYGNGSSIDHPPNTNEDIAVPDREKPALDEVISELHLVGQNREKMLETIAHYFGTKFTYSLWQEAPRVKDTNSTALSRFLLKTKSGHCEYFATATVLLLRELGIPARYNVGYAVHEASGGQYVVRQNDAHAWCRVWNSHQRTWEDFDTTPGTWLAMERQQRSSFQFLFDAWSRMVFEFSKFRWGQSHLRQYILWTLVPVLALLLYQIIFRSGRRKALQNSKAKLEDISRPGLDSELYQLESELAKRGLIRHSSEPVSFWLQRAMKDQRLSELRESLLQMLRLHYQYRFDPDGLTAPDREVLRRETATCLSYIRSER
jgi:transglutaminase-like putative cysteine protease